MRPHDFPFEQTNRMASLSFSAGCSVSFPVLATTTALLGAFLVSNSMSSSTAFATTSNACYASVGVQRWASSLNASPRMVNAIGLLSTPILLYVLLGGASFSFHASPVLGSPAHSFDILFGTMLAMHLLFVVIAANVAMVRQHSWTRNRIFSIGFDVIMVGTSLAFLLSVMVLIGEYDAWYNRRSELYTGFIVPVAIGYAPLRFAVTTWPSVVETVSVGGAFVSAFVLQGEHFGRRLDPSSSEYDLYHGHFHFFVATVTSILYTRIEQVFDCQRGTCSKDVALVSVFGAHALVAMILKESNVSVEAARVILITCACLLCLLANCLAAGPWLSRQMRWCRGSSTAAPHVPVSRSLSSARHLP